MSRNLSQPKWELYNLAGDISEQNDLASEMPARVAELDEIWQRMNGEMMEPRF